MRLQIFPTEDTVIVDGTKILTAIDLDTQRAIDAHWFINFQLVDSSNDLSIIEGTYSDGIAFINEHGEEVYEMHNVSQVTLKGKAIEGDEDTTVDVFKDTIWEEAEAGEHDSLVYYPYKSIPNAWAKISPASGYNVRQNAGRNQKRIGVLKYKEMLVSITERDIKLDQNNIWFKCKFSEEDFNSILAPSDDVDPIELRLQGTQGWVSL